MDKISVIMGIYNCADTLDESIQCIINQSYENWEIVIVDDSSTDNSVELYKELSENPKIHVFLNDGNQGAGYTKRRCVELAQGELCGFVDPDDLIADQDALAIMVQAHLDHPNASMIYSGYYDTDENLVVIGESRGTPLQGVSILESCAWPVRHFVSFKKEKYDLTVGIDPLMKRCVDYDMYYKLEEVGGIVHIDKLLYYYRHNTNSISLNDNAYKSRTWHSYTCMEAMKRRGLTDEKLMLYPIEDALWSEFKKGADHVKTTITYRVGEAVLAPLKWFRRLWEKG